jgi:AcrR family transcriptional regulator
MPEPPGGKVARVSNLREAQKRFTHDRLVAAAIERFSARGYAATTVDDIAIAAGATRATFYLHFKSKADLVRELMVRQQAELEPLWEPLKQMSPRPSRAVIRRWLEADVAAWETTRERTVVVLQAVAAEPDLSGTMAEWDVRELDLLTEAISHMGWRDEADARLHAILLFAQLQRIFAYWSLRDEVLDREQVIDALTESWWFGLRQAGRAVRTITTPRIRGTAGSRR